MNDTVTTGIEVKIVRLEPMRMASAYGFGRSPEEQAWTKLKAWMEKKDIPADTKSRRFFGFNNPCPAPGSPNYGYEQWITVGADVEPEGEIKVIDFYGGLYAVTHCQLKNITEVWHKLYAWREDSPYKQAYHPWLEECLTPGLEPSDEMEFDLYLPISE
jgi:DNA gyrase inhibitor GyrI